ncbi:hypothetical protein PLICRDRAFT_112049 [Plicaturopsis crispa FD-325 SS-3]|nr:hypothetical protein PLICRDRAFT_112049 [Plicaturopsis crispa FD-325 SS-3]
MVSFRPTHRPPFCSPIAGFFKGTSADQDRRFSDKELKLLKSMKFPPEFDKKVDMRKVNLQVIRPWIAKKIIELVGFEDEVVVEYAMGLLEDKQQPTPDPKKMQINLTGFLTNSTPSFMTSLWNLLLEAQESEAGVPRTFLEEKKAEMRNARAGDSRAFDERDRRARLDEIRDGDRGGRGGRGRGRGGRGRGRGGFDDDRGGRGRDSGWGGRGGVSISLPVMGDELIYIFVGTSPFASSHFSLASPASAVTFLLRLPLSVSCACAKIPLPSSAPVFIAYSTFEVSRFTVTSSLTSSVSDSFSLSLSSSSAATISFILATTSRQAVQRPGQS